MRRKFVLLFHEKQGTSPIVRLLDHFDAVDVVHASDGSFWEPFDGHNCGAMRLGDYLACLDMIFGPDPLRMDSLNETYLRTGRGPLVEIDESCSVGFKMRLQPYRNPWPRWRRRRLERIHREATLDLLARNDVFVFVAWRRDLLRWALSFYHGDGTGRPGHIQFDLASGARRREDIRPIRVDCDALARQIAHCRRLVEDDHRLLADLRGRGIGAATLEYEEFCRYPRTFFANALRHLQVEVSAAQIEAALAEGPYFEKVHPEDFSQFVSNHREVAERFGNLPLETIRRAR